LCNTGGGSSGFSSLPNVLSQTGKIKLESVQDAIKGSRWRVNNKPPKGTATQKDPEQIKKEALAHYYSNETREVGYDVFTSNCEQFAKKLRHDVAHSTQVINLLWLNE